MMEMRERIARAIESATDKFAAPVRYYVEPEARHRWEAANPDAEAFEVSADWELESWLIIADAVLEAMSEPSEAMKQAGEEEYSGGGYHWQHFWPVMINAARNGA